jgi:2-polyprenyl-3-methyl-5-hydroxy-6-metoxy-1,4-benzoquinol methylase
MEHVQIDHYESSGMHGSNPISMSAWLEESFEDDQRRFQMLKPEIEGKRVLDFGSGACGFLKMAKEVTEYVVGIEPERRVRLHWSDQLNIYSDISHVETADFHLILLFHVLEHLKDPKSTLTELKGLLRKNGRMVIEVPNSEDALLDLYGCENFSKFTYWSQHLWIFNSKNITILAEQAGLRVANMKYVQRYPLSNHLYWLSQGKPGGHVKWNFLNQDDLVHSYANTLARIGKTDTLIVTLESND